MTSDTVFRRVRILDSATDMAGDLLVRDGRIDTLVVALTDMQGRLVGKRVRLSCTVGRYGLMADTVEVVRRHVDQGYKRVKLKIEPGWDIDLLRAVRAEFPHIELTVDANSAYTLDMMPALRRIDEFDLHYIEQPLHWDDMVDHAQLARELTTMICLDETLTSPARVKASLDLGA